MDYYLLAFMFIVLIGVVVVYGYYLSDKKEQLASIERGFCPQCKQDSIELSDQRSAGCSSPKILTYKCVNCDYENSFAVGGQGSC